MGSPEEAEGDHPLSTRKKYTHISAAQATSLGNMNRCLFRLGPFLQTNFFTQWLLKFPPPQAMSLVAEEIHDIADERVQ